MMLLILLTASFLAGLGITFSVVYFMKGGVAYTILRAGDDNPLVIEQTRDGENINLKCIDDPSGGLWSEEDVDYMATEEAASNLNGIPCGFTTENSGVIIPLKFAAYTQWLSKQKDIHDDEELEERVLQKAKEKMAFKQGTLFDIKKDIGTDPNFDPSKGFKDIGARDVKWGDYDLDMSDVDFEKLDGFDMKIPLGNDEGRPLVRLQDFRRFMKQNINPALIRAKIEKRVAKIREELQGFHLDGSTGMSLFMVLLGIAIVLYVFMSGGA